MPAAFTPVTVDVLRPTGPDDDYGGETLTDTVLYSGLSFILSYPTARSVATLETAQGPGSAMRTKALLIAEPIPANVTIKRGDVCSVRGGSKWEVAGVRNTYEKTLQLDVELIE